MISIIIPIYNAEKYLDACLNSCLSQEYIYFEILAINDGSEDRSLELVKKYAEIDSRIIIIDKENEGLVKTRETGIKIARGEYVFFLDSDDTITPNALSVLWEDAQKTNADIVIGDIATVLESGKVINNTKNSLSLYDKKYILVCSIITKTILPSLCGRLIRRKMFERITLPYEYTIGEDVITNLKIIESNNPLVSIVNICIYNYIQHPGSMVNSLTNANQRMKYMLWVNKYLLDLTYSEKIDNCSAKFFLEEYFSYLRDGGTPCSNELSKLINENYLLNSWAVSQIPLWRIMMLRIFNKSRILGRIYRWFFVKFRSYFR